MFGSTAYKFVTGSYQEIIEMVDCYFAPFSSRYQDVFYGGNAAEFANSK